jgi:TatD DNase family protein
MPELIDTHCHLNEGSFDVDRADVVTRANAAGVVTMLCIGTTAATSRQAVEIAQQFPSVFAAVGIQPNYVAESKPGDWDVIEELVRQPKVVAIGETGLDRYWKDTPIESQVESFQRHIGLARRTGLPFVVHMRDCESDMVTELRKAAGGGSLRGVMHSFTGGWDTAQACLALGMHISFAGMVTYRKSPALLDVAMKVPLDRLLVETDSPYLAPQPVRGKRNEPAHVAYTAGWIAEARGLSRDDLAAATTRNARDLFRFAARVT